MAFRRISLVEFARAALAVAFRLACYAVMLWLALWAETRPAPSLPDLVLEHVPYVELADHYNYVLWLMAYVPVALALLFHDPVRFARYNVTAGLVALVRGLCLVATGLGPVGGHDANAGADLSWRINAFRQLYSFGLFKPDGVSSVYLSKDLFFSGHTATTFLLLLHVWKWPLLRWPMLAAHLAVVASLFLGHLHYTIDVIAAYAVTFTLYALREGWPAAGQPTTDR